MEMLKIPYTKQPNDYTCVPSCIKMAADYHKLKNPKTDKPWELNTIIKMCKTRRGRGTTLANLNKTLITVGLKRVKVDDIMDMLDYIEDKAIPVMAFIPDYEVPDEEDHCVLVKGLENNNTIVMADPYYGRNTRMHSVKFFEELTKADKDGGWLYAMEKA